MTERPSVLYFHTSNLMEELSKMAAKRVRLETTEGDIVVELYEDMPVTAGNFEKLVNKGFYDGIVFHRVIKGFMLHRQP